MKNHAQAILQFTGYPLEPIVALHLTKSFQSQIPVAHGKLVPKQKILSKSDRQVSVR